MTYTTIGFVRTKVAMSEFGWGTSGFDVTQIQPDTITGYELGGWGPMTVIVYRVVVLSLRERCLRFFDTFGHSIGKLGNASDLQTWLLRFKAHARVPTSIHEEGSLLRRWVNMVIVGKLA
jgi:hypothetical protein